MIDETGTGTKVISHTSYSLSCLNIHMSNFKIINASKSLSWLCKKIPCTSVFFFIDFMKKVRQTLTHIQILNCFLSMSSSFAIFFKNSDQQLTVNTNE